MGTRTRHIQNRLDAGAISPGFHDRHDSELRARGAKVIKNCYITQEGTARVRPATLRVTPWDSDWYRDGVSIDLEVANVRIIPYRAQDTQLIGVPKNQDYGIVITDSTTSDNEYDIKKFDPKQSSPASAVANLVSSDDTIDFIDNNTTLWYEQTEIQHVQADRSVFIVSDNFHPQRFVEEKDSDVDTGAMQQLPANSYIGVGSGVQFYKDTHTCVKVSANGKVSGPPGSTFKDTFSAASDDLSYVRIFGIEYEISGVTNDTNMNIIGWPGDVIDEFTVRIQRRWPVDNVANDRGNQVKDDNETLNTAFFRPRCVGFFAGRSIFACSMNGLNEKLYGPSRIWMSATNDPFTIMPSDFYLGFDAGATATIATPADRPIAVDMFMDEADRIVWVKGLDKLYIGGQRGIYIVTHGPEGPTPGNIGFQKISNVGGRKNSPAIEYDGRPVYATDIKGRIGGIDGNAELLRTMDSDPMVHARHLAGNIERMVVTKASDLDPIERIWMLNGDNTAVVGTRPVESSIYAWTEFEIPSVYKIWDVLSMEGDTFLLVTESVNATQTGSLWKMDLDATYRFEIPETLSVATSTTEATTSWTTTEDTFKGQDGLFVAVTLEKLFIDLVSVDAIADLSVSLVQGGTVGNQERKRITVTAATNDGVYTIEVVGKTFTFTADSNATQTEIRDGLSTLIQADSDVTDRYTIGDTTFLGDPAISVQDKVIATYTALEFLDTAPGVGTGVFTVSQNVYNVIIGFPIIGKIESFYGIGADERGLSVGRRTRVRAMAFNIKDTPQIYVDEVVLLSDMLQPLDEDPVARTGTFRRLFLGTSVDDRTVVIRSAPPHPFELRTITQEIVT